MKKGFTLIELLAVIIILAVVSIIATPMVLDVIDDSKDSTNKSIAYNIIDAANLYYAESMFDETKSNKIKNLDNIYNDINVNGKKPDDGALYINEKGLAAISVEIDGKCYKKEFANELEVTDSKECRLNYIGNDSVPPVVGDFTTTLSLVNGWAKEDFWVNIAVTDNEAGVNKFMWCISNDDCEPNNGSTISGSTGSVKISTEGENRLCVRGYDNNANFSLPKCETYKLDKTKPEFSGISDITIIKGEVINLTSGVNTTDTLSGIDEEYTYTPTTIDTSVAGTTNVIYSVSDLAGNTNSITRKIIVDAEAPRVVFSNDYGWHKDNFYAPVTLVDNSELGIQEAKWCITQEDTCLPNAIKGAEDINPQITVESNNNRICVYLKDNNNKENTMCSDAYKLDKTAPTAGTFNISGTMGSNGWYTSDVTISSNVGSDSLSGHNSSSVNISSITTNTSGTMVTLTTTDNAGNSSSATATIKIDKNAPIISANSMSVTVESGNNNDILGTYFNYNKNGDANITSTSCVNNINENVTNVAQLKPGTNVVTCTINKENGLSSQDSITINLTNNGNYYFVGYSSGSSSITYKVLKYVYNGSTWTSSQVMTVSGQSYYAASNSAITTYTDISVSAINENIVFVSYAFGDSSGNVTYSTLKYTYNGSTWTQNQVMTAVGGAVLTISSPVVIVDDNTSISIDAVDENTLFIGYATGSSSITYKVFKYTYNGTSWTSSQVMTTTAESYYVVGNSAITTYADISVSAINENIVFVSYAYGASSGNITYTTVKYKYSGSTWSSSNVASTTTSATLVISSPVILMDDNTAISVDAVDENTIFIGYATGSSSITYNVLKYVYNGTSWNSSNVMATTAESYYAVSNSAITTYSDIGISAVNGNTIFISYAYGASNENVTYTTKKYVYNGSTWTLSNVAGDTVNATLVISSPKVMVVDNTSIDGST